MGYQRKKRFGPIVEEYGPWIGGHRYKRFRPDPLAVTVLKFAAEKSAVNSSIRLLLDAILAHVVPNDKVKNYYSSKDKRRVYLSLQYLKRKHFIAFPGKGIFTITKQGRERLSKIKIDKIKVRKPAKWDNKWRLLTFDIPEEKTNLRDYLRKRLKEIGFYHFQRSVFVIPFPCQEEVAVMCEELGLTSSVHVITGDRFEGDEDLVKRYALN